MITIRHRDPDALAMLHESQLELALWTQLERDGLPMPLWQAEVVGHRWDFCYPDRRLLIECQGGTAGFGKGRGRHVREPGYSEDRARANRAQLDGWTVLEFTVTHINSGEALDVLREVLE